MLTKIDLQQIGKVVKAIIDTKLFDFRAEVREIVKDEIKHLPTKEEYYVREDRIMTELQNIRDDISVMVGWKDDIEENKNRVKRLEKHVGIASPAS